MSEVYNREDMGGSYDAHNQGVLKEGGTFRTVARDLRGKNLYFFVMNRADDFKLVHGTLD